MVNSTLLRWTYYHSNDSLIDSISLTKDHAGVFERVLNERQHFVSINGLDSFLESEANNKNGGLSRKQTKRAKYMFIFVLVAFILLGGVACLAYYVKRYLNQRKQIKINTNYSNLIESEFDA